ncbi:metallophosphoesterase family protein [Rhizobium etli]|uniref:metallophosphoesterase family protein n=1 Tax=Rhizobium etli TaxID=29449 RepID=UPI0003839B6A|nr:metallophosphoesterase [Rhizobium etli]AGS25227.1 metallophosphoesterase domain-containing protein [Rhizobium etli bv. mimosae str. Mim1]
MSEASILFLGDSCIGTDPAHAATLAEIVELAMGLVDSHNIGAAIFLGDQIMGYCGRVELRAQWSGFHSGPMRRLSEKVQTLRHIASNHVWYDEQSALEYEEQNGHPEWLQTIAGIQFVAINTARIDRGGDAGIDCQSLENALSRLDRGKPIIVVGHHPIWPINGYDRAPQWVVPADEGEKAWRIMQENNVRLYVCSHIIAFDVQLKRGLAQVCTGGAGTKYGAHSAMPGQAEAPHLVLASGLGSTRMRIERIGMAPAVREVWALTREVNGWRYSNFGQVDLCLDLLPSDATGYGFSISRAYGGEGSIEIYAHEEGPAICTIEYSDARIVLNLTPSPGEDARQWTAKPTSNWSFAQIEIIAGAGPGGVLLRFDSEPQSSMKTVAARGLEEVRRVTGIVKAGSGNTRAAFLVPGVHLPTNQKTRKKLGPKGCRRSGS